MNLSPDIITRRLFRNHGGDWKKVEKMTKEIETYAQVVDDLAKDLVKADAKLRDLMLAAYKEVPKTDCLFYDSPVSPSRQTLHLKCYLKKLGWDGVRDVMTASIAIEPFSKNIKEAMRWLLKFKNDEAT